MLAVFFLEFALKMKCLVALCIVPPLLDENAMQNIRFRIAKTVGLVRSSLWFNIGGECPTRSDPDVPGIHYNELVEPMFCFPSPF